MGEVLVRVEIDPLIAAWVESRSFTLEEFGKRAFHRFYLQLVEEDERLRAGADPNPYRGLSNP